MNRTGKKLIVAQLDRKLQPFRGAAKVERPQTGWIRSLRTGLNMSMRQLGERLGVSKQGVRDLESREVRGTVTLQTLEEVAKALGMRFVYGFVPEHGTIRDTIEQRAEEVSRSIVLRTSHSMDLEGQKVSNARLREAVRERARSLADELPRNLWD